MPALIAITAVLGAIFATLIIAFLVLKFKKPSSDLINAPPNTTNQVKALQKSTAEWSIPYEELQLGRLLGKGSQGEVYLASWRGTTVAVKKVDVEKVDPEIIGEFCMEAEMMKRLRHPDLTLFMGVSISHPHLCIVTEYVEKGSLFDLLKDPTAPLTWQRCLRLALDVAQGMNYLHEFKPTPILHRDLKSLNILIDGNWRAKVADFGMTRFQQDGTMTQCGSPLWMAPEMIRNLPYDEKADVYSFGICLWELYTKKIPYRGTGLAPSVLVVKVYQEHFRPEIPIKCPLAYVRLIEQCWHPVPSKRPTFIQIIKALEGFLVDPTIMNHKPFSEREDLTIPRPISEEKKDLLTARPGGNWMVSFSKEVVLDAKIGQGRSATVYRGHFRGKEVAVKQWLVNLQAVEHKKEVVERVTNIMQLISQLRHPNILLFMGAFIEERHVGMLVEHMPRGTLRDIIADQKVVLHWDTVLQFLIDVAAGMTYLHANNPPILHGDLKSSRLLVDDNWRVKISGYGIIDFASSIQSVNPSVWTAPEVLEDPMNGNAASNSYSFGMILFELVTRTIPFANEHFNTNLAQKILNGHRPVVPNSVSKPFADLIKACWHPDPIKRPTFPEILNHLTRMKEEGPPKTVLSASNSFLYHKASTVYAWKSKDAVTIVKDWGKNIGKPGCYVVLSGEDDAYLCAEDVFHQTYQRVGQSSNEYRKLGTIRARRMDQPFAIKTQDGVEHGGAGDYLVQNDSGDQWCIEGHVFPTLYEVDEEQ